MTFLRRPAAREARSAGSIESAIASALAGPRTSKGLMSMGSGVEEIVEGEEPAQQVLRQLDAIHTEDQAAVTDDLLEGGVLGRALLRLGQLGHLVVVRCEGSDERRRCPPKDLGATCFECGRP